MRTTIPLRLSHAARASAASVTISSTPTRLPASDAIISVTSASFQARLSASAMPELPPRAPNGFTTLAASPRRNTRPCRIRSTHSLRYA